MILSKEDEKVVDLLMWEGQLSCREEAVSAALELARNCCYATAVESGRVLTEYPNGRRERVPSVFLNPKF
jgi:hypothetical protein